MQLSHQYQLSKAKRTERQQLESTLARQERSIRTAFSVFMDTTQSDGVMKQVRQLLGAKDVNGAVDIVDQHVVALGRVIPQAFVDAAGIEAKAMATRLSSASGVSIGFDPSNPQAAALMRNAQLQFVQQFSTGQRDATRVALANAYQRGAGTVEAAQAFKDSIGLTRSQLEAVENYRLLLENGSADALSRDLRDRRYDPSVTRAVEDGDMLESSQIDRMVDRYRDNMLSYRAENIARTEGLGVVGQARQEALDQLVDQAGFEPDSVQRTWRATLDKRTRDSHAAMDGQSVGMNKPFVTPGGEELMYPGDPSASAGERINCRCSIEISFT